jgi:hypothetical protein
MEERPLWHIPRHEVIRFYIETLANEGGNEMEETREYESSYARWDALHPSILWVDGPEGFEEAVVLTQGETFLLLSLELEGAFDELLAEMDRLAQKTDWERRKWE